MSEDYLPEDQTHIEDRTREHEPEQHGWLSCEVESCECQGAWTE